jgi:hypothetical protein
MSVRHLVLNKRVAATTAIPAAVIPYVGRPMYGVAERNWLALGGTVALLGLCLYVAFPGRPKREDDTDPGSGAGRSGRGRRVAAAVTIGVVAAGALAGPAEAAFRKSIGNSSSFAAATTFYPYRTAVCRTAPRRPWCRCRAATGAQAPSR